MFTWLEGGNVQGPGYAVSTGFNFVVYCEGDRKITMTIKRGFSDRRHALSIAPEAFDHWDDGATIDIQDRERLRRNFVEAMDFAGCVVL